MKLKRIESQNKIGLAEEVAAIPAVIRFSQVEIIKPDIVVEKNVPAGSSVATEIQKDSKEIDTGKHFKLAKKSNDDFETRKAMDESLSLSTSIGGNAENQMNDASGVTYSFKESELKSSGSSLQAKGVDSNPTAVSDNTINRTPGEENTLLPPESDILPPQLDPLSQTEVPTELPTIPTNIIQSLG